MKPKKKSKIKPKILAAGPPIDPTPGVEILNEKGTKTVILLGGGEYGDAGPLHVSAQSARLRNFP